MNNNDLFQASRRRFLAQLWGSDQFWTEYEQTR